MTDDLKAIIERAYPTGLHNEPDESQYFPDTRMVELLDGLCADNGLRYYIDWEKQKCGFALTLKDHIPFEEWLYLGNPKKLEWLSNNDQLYPVLWIHLSRVAGFYTWHYNHWTPRGDTGYLDGNFRVEPTNIWLEKLALIESSLNKEGFSHLSREAGWEIVPFVLFHDWDAVPKDDPRWNEDDFEPPLVPASLYICLFGEQ